jgi:hypothetical protein
MCGGQTATPADRSRVGVCGLEKRVCHVVLPWVGIVKDSGVWVPV